MLIYTITAEDYFYPRSPCGERLIEFRKLLYPGNFYPRSPCGERHVPKKARFDASNFYPRSPCGERHNINSSVNTADKISIHALLAESDYLTNYHFTLLFIFLSTLSLRRATISASREASEPIDFYPRSPCGERRQQPDGTTRTTYFYPRSPCGERRY